MFNINVVDMLVLGGIFFRLFYLTPYRLAVMISSSDY